MGKVILGAAAFVWVWFATIMFGFDMGTAVGCGKRSHYAYVEFLAWPVIIPIELIQKGIPEPKTHAEVCASYEVQNG